MIVLQIRSWSSPDVELQTWEPEELDAVQFLLELEIGAAASPGADVFSVLVATPEALRAHAPPGALVLRQRSTLVLGRYDWPELRAAVTQIVASCAGRDWQESVLRLQRHFRWEYEDYRMEDGH